VPLNSVVPASLRIRGVHPRPTGIQHTV